MVWDNFSPVLTHGPSLPPLLLSIPGLPSFFFLLLSFTERRTAGGRGPSLKKKKTVEENESERESERGTEGPKTYEANLRPPVSHT